VIIYGWRRTVGDRWQGRLHCNFCGSWGLHYGLRVRRWLTLFFIPVFRLWGDWLVECGSCECAYKVKRSDWEAIKQASGVITYAWQLYRGGREQEATELIVTVFGLDERDALLALQGGIIGEPSTGS